MAACLTREQLQLLVADGLSASELGPVEEHVEGCSLCQEILEHLTGPGLDPPLGGPRHNSRQNTRVETLAAPHLDFLRSLAHAPPDCEEPVEKTKEEIENSGSSFLLETTSFPGFELVSVLGQGGMSVVFKARQARLNRLVALKVLSRFHAGNQELARFRAEAEAIASLRHPNIVQVYEFGENAGRPYFTLELIDGGTLAERLKGQPQDPSTAARLVETVARAVQYAHENGIIHRDLKPANILLQKIAGSGQPAGSRIGSRQLTTDYSPQIADFGLAKQLFVKGEQTQSGAILGTPSYMPPEQAQGRLTAKGPAVDIYSLGAILYEMLTGRPPFVGATPLETLRQTVHDEPVSVIRLMPSVPRDLETICLKCLEKEPGRRYGSALALAEDLHRFLGQEPIAARPSSIVDHCGKFARRNKGFVGGTLAVMLALLAGTVASLTFALGEGHQRKLALEQAGLAETARKAAVREAYQAHLGAAVICLGERDLTEAAIHLDAVPSDLRGWEWQHLHRRLIDASPVVARLPGDCGDVLALLGGGQLVLTRALKGGVLRLYDAATGALRQTLPPGEVTWVGQTQNGPLVAIYNRGEGFYLADGTGPVRRTFMRLGHSNYASAVSRDGTLLAAAFQPEVGESRLEIRELSSGGLRRAIPGAGPLFTTGPNTQAPMARLAFSPDGKWLAAVCSDQTARLWEVASGAARAVCRGHQGVVRGVTFHPEGQAFLSWGEDGALCQWRVPDGQALNVCRGPMRRVYDATYSVDGQWILSGSADRSARLWRTAGGEALAVLRGDTGVLKCVAFHPDGGTLVTASGGGTVRFWPLPGQENTWILREPTGFVRTVAFSPNGRWFASGGRDNVVRIWDAASGVPITVLSGPKDWVNCVAISPDGNRLVARSGEGKIWTWDTRSGALLFDAADNGFKRTPVPERNISGLPQNLAISPDGARVACGLDNRVRFWDLTTGQEQAGPALPVQGAIRHVVFSPDGRQLAIAAREPALCLVDSATGQVLHDLHGHAGLVYAVSFSPDGNRLASAGDDLTIRLWDTATGKLQQELHGHTEKIYTVVFHPDGSRMASAGLDRVVRIWDTTSHAELARLPGHTDGISSLAWSPDGSTLVSGSTDLTVRLWDTVPLADRRAERAELTRLRPEAERLVEKLFHELGEPAKVLERIHSHAAWSPPMQRAAWHAVLKQAAATKGPSAAH